MNFYSFIFLFFAITFHTELAAQNKINSVLESFKQDTELKYATFSFCAIDINSNKIYAEHNSNTALVPASSMKVITTGSALAILGSNFKFKTYLEYSGSISNGVLNGNIYIRGTGDPSLGSPIMEGVLSREALMNVFVNAIKKAGIKKINGAIIGDGSYLDDKVMIDTWQWGDIGNHYGAGSFGLNYHDNLYYIHFKRQRDYGDATPISHTVPATPNLNFDNRVTSAGSRSGDNAYVYAAPFGNTVTVQGTIPKGRGLFSVKGAMPDPALNCAQDLHQFLINNSINISTPATTQRQQKTNPARKTLYTYTSPSLDKICKHTNEDSRNMYCEALIKAIGIKQKQQGSTKAGIAAVQDFWRGRGLDMHGFFMKDGCGLSARNGISSKTFAQIMRKMYIDKSSFGDFYNQLAIAGKTGTLKNMCRNSYAENNIRAKSGSMNRIRSYTGFVTLKSGKKLSFSILVNNYSCSGYAMKKKLETLMIALAEST